MIKKAYSNDIITNIIGLNISQIRILKKFDKYVIETNITKKYIQYKSSSKKM